MWQGNNVILTPAISGILTLPRLEPQSAFPENPCMIFRLLRETLLARMDETAEILSGAAGGPECHKLSIRERSPHRISCQTVNYLAEDGGRWRCSNGTWPDPPGRSARIQGDTSAVEEEGGRIRKLQRPAIQPHQVRGRRHSDGDLGRSRASCSTTDAGFPSSSASNRANHASPWTQAVDCAMTPDRLAFGPWANCWRTAAPSLPPPTSMPT